MARYLYKCKDCNIEVTVEKPMKEYNRAEYCEKCNKELTRVYEATHNKWNCDGSYAKGSY